MFKDAISVPGLTLKYMFQNLPDYFTLPDEKNKDLYDLYTDQELFHGLHVAVFPYSLAQLVVFGRDIFVFQSTVEGFVRGELADVEYMFQDLPDYFTVPDEKNNYLYDLYKNNIVGGPSIVFHRYHEKDKTFIHSYGKNPFCSVHL
jgi:hypothetical protein